MLIVHIKANISKYWNPLSFYFIQIIQTKSHLCSGRWLSQTDSNQLNFKFMLRQHNCCPRPEIVVISCKRRPILVIGVYYMYLICKQGCNITGEYPFYKGGWQSLILYVNLPITEPPVVGLMPAFACWKQMWFTFYIYTKFLELTLFWLHLFLPCKIWQQSTN